MAKLPAFQFYPGDWMKDPDLRRCSHCAKGLLMDLLCLMFESEERGVLATAGQAWTDDEIAQAAGGDRTTTLALLSELTLKGVCARRQDGALYSKRMVRDEHKRRACSEAGKRGGNPALKGDSKGSPKGESKRKPTPSSSSSSSTSVEKPPNPLSIPAELATEAFSESWQAFKQHRKEKGRPVTATSEGRLLKKLAKMGAAVATEALDNSVTNGWQGVFPPDQKAGRTFAAPKPSRPATTEELKRWHPVYGILPEGDERISNG